jgi:vanillate/3-O-methylgallate O-demethylase
VNPDVEVGSQLHVLWGEPETTGKRSAQPHLQYKAGVDVSPVPYSEVVRRVYTEGGWRKNA